LSENFHSGQSVEISIKTQWWLGLIILPIMPFCLIMAYITDPDFKELEAFVLIITIFAIFEIAVLVISLLGRKITKRFSVDSSARSLVFKKYWSGLRILKKIYPFETIDKFDLIFRNVAKGQYSMQKVEILTLVFQSGKMKYLTSTFDRENIKTWAAQLNVLLQVQGGFPAERFAEPLVAHWPTRKQNLVKMFFLISLFVFVLFSVTILITLVIMGVL